MPIRDLIPWRHGERGLVREGEEHPLAGLHREMNQLFEDFFRGLDLPLARSFAHLGGFVPSVDVRETDKQVIVSAELPGMDEKDIHVELADDGLTIRGEKKTETEEDAEGLHRHERTYGSFQRLVAIPVQVQEAKATAKFKNGVLTVTLPKAPEAQAKRKRIQIKTD